VSRFDEYFGSTKVSYETFSKIALGSSRGIDFSMLQAMDPRVTVRMMDNETRLMVMEMQAYIWGKEDSKMVPIYYWATWWDHLRADHAPKWMNRRWPPKRKLVQRLTVYAHVLFPELSKHVNPGTALHIARIDNPFNYKEYPFNYKEY
jgi:hypothetical protein